MNGFQWRVSNYFPVPVFICPGLHMFVDLNYNFSCKENKINSRRSLIMLGFVWGRSVNYSPSLLSTRMIYVTTTLVQTWRSLCSTWAEKKHYKSGMCRFSVMPMGRLSVLSTPVAGSVTSHTRRVFSTHKRSNSWHENNMCNPGHIKTGTKK